MFQSTCVILSVRHTSQGHSPKGLYTYASSDRGVAWEFENLTFWRRNYFF